MMLATFYYSLYAKYRDKSDSFPLVDSMGRFLIGEYGNQVAALSVLYEHVYSRHYATHGGVVSDWRMQNLIAKARRLQMQEQEFSNRTANSRFNFAKVLEYRLRLEKTSDLIGDAISDKIRLYSDLSGSEIDYLAAIKTGSKVYCSTNAIQRAIDELLAVSDRNFSLLREAAVFEMCVQEKPFLSDKLQKKLTAFLEERQNKGDVSETSEKAKLSFSVYDSSNVVLFLSFEDNDYRCNSFTRNAVDLFGAPAEDIQGNTLTEFMPREVGVSHNRLVFDFLNGNSKAKKSGKFNSFVISRQGKIKSAMVQPKLDAAFLDNVYIAGLAVPREKNKNPIVYTTHTGLVIGMNMKAHTMLNHTLEEMGTNSPIFTTIPGLYQNYVTADSEGQTQKFRQPSRFLNDIVTAKDFEQSKSKAQKQLTAGTSLPIQSQNSFYMDITEKSIESEIYQTQAFMFQIDKILATGALMDQKYSRGLPSGELPQQTTGDHADPGEQPLDTELVQPAPTIADPNKQNTIYFATDEHNSSKLDMLPDKGKKDRKKEGSKKHKKKKENLSYRANMTRLTVEHLAQNTQETISLEEVLDRQRVLLNKKNVRVFKSSLAVENNRFQGELLYKEVEIKGYLKSGATERSVLKTLYKAPADILEEVLMSNPSCLSLYNKASLYIRIGNAIDVLLRKRMPPAERNIQQANLMVQPTRDKMRLNTDITDMKGKNPVLVIHKVPRTEEEEDNPRQLVKAPSMHSEIALGRTINKKILTPEGTIEFGDDGQEFEGNFPQHNFPSSGLSPIPNIYQAAKGNKSSVDVKPSDEASYTTNDNQQVLKKHKHTKEMTPLTELGLVTAYATSPVEVLVPKGNTAILLLKKKQKEFQSKLFDVKEELTRIARSPDMVDKVIDYICQAKEAELSFIHTYTKQSSFKSQLLSAYGDYESVLTAESPNSANVFDGAYKIEGLLDELVANTEESSDEEPSDNPHPQGVSGGHIKKAEERSHETKPMAPGQSTYAKSSRRDFSTISEAIFTRDSIENADKHLQYHKWTYVMLGAVILCFSMKTLFSLLLVAQNYKYVDASASERRVATLKEAVGFFGRYTSDLGLAKQLVRSSAPASLQSTRESVYSFLTATSFAQHTKKLDALSREVDISLMLEINIRNESPQTKLVEDLTVSEAVFKIRLASKQLATYLAPENKLQFLELIGRPESGPTKSYLEVLRLEVSSIAEQISESALAFLSDAGPRKQILWVFWWVLIILNLFGEVYSLVAYPTVIGKIILSIQHQTFRASEVLLRIDKSAFRKAVFKILSQTTPDESGNEESTLFNKAGSKLLKRADLQNDISMKLANEFHEAIGEQRDSHDDGSVIMPVVGRKKQARALGPRKQNVPKNEKKGYSVFMNRVAPYSTAKTYTLTCSIVIFFDILYMAAWVYSFTTLSNLKLVMDNSVVFGTAKASTTALATAFNYKYLTQAGVDFPIYGKPMFENGNLYLDFVKKAQNTRVDQFSDS